jgi:hypothetical protein
MVEIAKDNRQRPKVDFSYISEKRPKRIYFEVLERAESGPSLF